MGPSAVIIARTAIRLHVLAGGLFIPFSGRRGFVTGAIGPIHT
jgi:hypothetical protein